MFHQFRQLKPGAQAVLSLGVAGAVGGGAFLALRQTTKNRQPNFTTTKKPNLLPQGRLWRATTSDGVCSYIIGFPTIGPMLSNKNELDATPKTLIENASKALISAELLEMLAGKKITYIATQGIISQAGDIKDIAKQILKIDGAPADEQHSSLDQAPDLSNSLSGFAVMIPAGVLAGLIFLDPITAAAITGTICVAGLMALGLVINSAISQATLTISNSSLEDLSKLLTVAYYFFCLDHIDNGKKMSEEDLVIANTAFKQLAILFTTIGGVFVLPLDFIHKYDLFEKLNRLGLKVERVYETPNLEVREALIDEIVAITRRDLNNSPAVQKLLFDPSAGYLSEQFIQKLKAECMNIHTPEGKSPGWLLERSQKLYATPKPKA